MGKVTNSNRIYMAHRDGLAQLSTNGVVRSDEGLYRCCILNSLGSDIRECQLVVLGMYRLGALHAVVYHVYLMQYHVYMCMHA